MKTIKNFATLIAIISSLAACSQASTSTATAALPAVFSLSSEEIYKAAESSPYSASIAAQVKAMSLEQYYQLLTRMTSNDKVIVDGTDVFSGSLNTLKATHDRFKQLGANFATVGAAWESIKFDPGSWTYQEFKGTFDGMAAAARGTALALDGAAAQSLPPIRLKKTKPGDFCSLDMQVLYNMGIGEKHLVFEINKWRNLTANRMPILAGVFPTDGEVDLRGDRSNPSLVFFTNYAMHDEKGEDDQGAFTKACTELEPSNASAAASAAAS